MIDATITALDAGITALDYVVSLAAAFTCGGVFVGSVVYLSMRREGQ